MPFRSRPYLFLQIPIEVFVNTKGKQIKSIAGMFVSEQIKMFLDVELMDPYTG